MAAGPTHTTDHAAGNRVRTLNGECLRSGCVANASARAARSWRAAPFHPRGGGSGFAPPSAGGAMSIAPGSWKEILDRLADVESEGVVSLYIELKPDQPAQDYKAFLADAEKEH